MSHKDGGGLAARQQAAAIQKEEERYQGIYRPLNKRLLADTNSRSYIDAAQEQANIGSEHRTQRTERDLARFGVDFDPQLQQHNAVQNQQGDALRSSVSLNNARFAQFDRNQALRREMINIGRGISQSGMEGLNTAAKNGAQRIAANDAAAAQRKAGYQQLAGTVIGAGAGYMMAAMLL